MNEILGGLGEALRLVVTWDAEIVAVTWLSLKVSGTATFLAMALGMPLGTLLAFGRFPGRRLCVALVHTGMGLPPVVVGLAVTLLLWRTGPLGAWGLLYTPTAMVLAQLVIALPIVAGLTRTALESLDPRLRLQAQALGATPWQTLVVLYREARMPLLAALMAGFGGVISEVGAVMMVGGNLKGATRVLTTATVTETRQGHFDRAIALGAILLVLTFLVNWGLTRLQERKGRP